MIIHCLAPVRAGEQKHTPGCLVRRDVLSSPKLRPSRGRGSAHQHIYWWLDRLTTMSRTLSKPRSQLPRPRGVPPRRRPHHAHTQEVLRAHVAPFARAPEWLQLFEYCWLPGFLLSIIEIAAAFLRYVLRSGQMRIRLVQPPARRYLCVLRRSFHSISMPADSLREGFILLIRCDRPIAVACRIALACGAAARSPRGDVTLRPRVRLRPGQHVAGAQSSWA